MDFQDPMTILYVALAMLGAAILGVAGKVVGALGDALIKKIRNEEVKAGLAVVGSEASIVVDMIEQTLKPQLVASLADGKIDEQEMAALRETALSALKGRFGADFWERLFAAVGVPPEGRDKWLLAVIEAYVLRQKSSAAA